MSLRRIFASLCGAAKPGVTTMSSNDELISHANAIKQAAASINQHADAIITIAGQTPPPDGGGGTDPVIPPNTVVMQMSWSAPQRLFSSSVGGFPPDRVIAVEFTTGPTGTTTSLPRFTAAEYQGPPLPRYAVISKLPGDFTMAAQNLYSGPSNSVTVTFAIAPGTNAFYGQLQPSTRYYFNIRNESGQGGDIFVDLVKSGV